MIHSEMTQVTLFMNKSLNQKLYLTFNTILTWTIKSIGNCSFVQILGENILAHMLLFN